MDDVLDSAGRMLAGLSASTPADPVASALVKAPVDDEPVTPPPYAEAVAEGERDVKEGRVISAAELRRCLGL